MFAFISWPAIKEQAERASAREKAHCQLTEASSRVWPGAGELPWTSDGKFGLDKFVSTKLESESESILGQYVAIGASARQTSRAPNGLAYGPQAERELARARLI